MPALPPFPPENRLLGNMPLLAREIRNHNKEPLPALSKVYEDFKDPATQTLALSLPGAGDLWLTANPEFVERISTDLEHFGKITHTDSRGPMYSARAVVKDSLFTASDTEKNWGKAHRILMPAFSPSSLKSLVQTTIDKTDSLIGQVSDGKPFEAGDITTGLTFDGMFGTLVACCF